MRERRRGVPPPGRAPDVGLRMRGRDLAPPLRVRREELAQVGLQLGRRDGAARVP